MDTKENGLSRRHFLQGLGALGVAAPLGCRAAGLPRRWVVERTLAWLSKCRGILVRYEKKSENYLGVLQPRIESSQ